VIEASRKNEAPGESVRAGAAWLAVNAVQLFMAFFPWANKTERSGYCTIQTCLVKSSQAFNAPVQIWISQ
jgi:hypothetical protein